MFLLEQACAQQEDMLARCRAGESLQKVARLYGTNRSFVWRVCKAAGFDALNRGERIHVLPHRARKQRAGERV
jgi:hypothetical protein